MFIMEPGPAILKINESSPMITPDKKLESYKTVNEFYSLQQQKKFAKSCDYLAPASGIKLKMKTKELLAKGYKNTIAIDLLAILLESQSSDATHKYIAYYMDEVKVHNIPELVDIQKLRLNQRNVFFNRIDGLKSSIQESGFSASAIDHLTFRQLFAPNRSDKILLNLYLENNNQSVAHLYPDKVVSKSLAGYRVHVQKYGDKWLIERISPLL